MKNILVLCTGNSCRSQIAEGYLRSLSDERFQIYSAGIETHGLNPRAVQVMQDDGVDISKHTSNHISEYNQVQFDHVITVCDNAKECCPTFPQETELEHHSFPDPAKALGNEDEILGEFRHTQYLIKEYCQDFVSRI
ncbi:MAG: arsenate reductase [bacterium]|jgi:arsenate reductase